MIAAVAFPALLESLFLYQRQAFVQRVEHRNRHSVMVLVLFVITVKQLQIEIPGLHRRRAFLQASPGARRNGERRKSRRAAQTLLRSRVDRVDVPGVDFDGNATQRRDGVDNQQRAGVVN